MFGISKKQEQENPDNIASARQVVEMERGYNKIQKLIQSGMAEIHETKDEKGLVIEKEVRLKDGTLLFYRNEKAIRETESMQ